MSEVGFTVSVRRVADGGVPVTARFPACSAACAAAVRDRWQRPERPPVPVESLAWLFAGPGPDSPGGWFKAVRGATIAPPRPPRVTVGPAEVDAECCACGAAVRAAPPVVGSAVVAVADDVDEADAVDVDEW